MPRLFRRVSSRVAMCSFLHCTRPQDRCQSGTPLFRLASVPFYRPSRKILHQQHFSSPFGEARSAGGGTLKRLFFASTGSGFLSTVTPPCDSVRARGSRDDNDPIRRFSMHSVEARSRMSLILLNFNRCLGGEM